MTTWLIRHVPRLLTVAVLAGSGVYVLVYLYRWQWNRALISAVFFLAAEIALVGSTVIREVRALASRIEAVDEPAERRLHARLGAAAARPARSFAWLRDTPKAGVGVFVPVLLGAGVILSALAFVVERLAGAVAHGTADRSTAGLLVSLEPAAHGLLGRPGRPRPAATTGVRAGGMAAVAGRIVVIGVLVLTVGAAIDLLADVTQSRPSSAASGTATVIELSIDQRRDRPLVETAEALGSACLATLGSRPELAAVSVVDGGRVRIEVEPVATDLQRRRFVGCLEDTTLAFVQARVTSWGTLTRESDVGRG
ncbi:MAG TPA: hypothetical protein VFI47_29555 [Acidimicrobiales bacterium]|nr:hypothetical protein [Acidimicrobiales bacterium]